MNYGYIDPNGNKWCDAWVNSYNRYTNDVMQYSGKIVVAGSICDDSLQFAIEQRDRFVVWCVKYLNENKT